MISTVEPRGPLGSYPTKGPTKDSNVLRRCESLTRFGSLISQGLKPWATERKRTEEGFGDRERGIRMSKGQGKEYNLRKESQGNSKFHPISTSGLHPLGDSRLINPEQTGPIVGEWKQGITEFTGIGEWSVNDSSWKERRRKRVGGTGRRNGSWSWGRQVERQPVVSGHCTSF